MKRLAIPVLAAAVVAFATPAFAGEGGGCGGFHDSQSVSMPQPVDTAEKSTPTPTPVPTIKDETSG